MDDEADIVIVEAVVRVPIDVRGVDAWEAEEYAQELVALAVREACEAIAAPRPTVRH